ncbi:PRA1 family protein 1 [Nematocida sp. AWRm77]|nr:PRA1 family protein 1 [Nematocida sp. AWRm77]
MALELSTNVTQYIKERLESKVPLAEFCDCSSLSLPENMESAKARIVVNYGNMFGNYAILLSVVLCLFLLVNPFLIIPVGFSLGLLYITVQREGEDVQILGSAWKKEQLYAVSVATLLIVFIAMPRTLGSLLFTVSLGLTISLAHMAVVTPKNKENEI